MLGAIAVGVAVELDGIRVCAAIVTEGTSTVGTGADEGEETDVEDGGTSEFDDRVLADCSMADAVGEFDTIEIGTTFFCFESSIGTTRTSTGDAVAGVVTAGDRASVDDGTGVETNDSSRSCLRMLAGSNNSLGSGICDAFNIHAL